MARIKVKLADNLARVVFLESEATKGATLSTNLYLPNGNVATPATLLAYLGITDGVTVTGGSGSSTTNHAALANLTVGDPHTQYIRKATLTAQGDLLSRGASAPERIPPGTDGHVLTMVAGYPTWSAPSGGGGAEYLTELLDVEIYSPADGDVLTYDLASGMWVPLAPTGGGGGADVPVLVSGAKVRRTTDQAVSPTTWTAISFTSEEYDDNAYWSSGNASRFTALEAGDYVVVVQAYWTSSTNSKGLFIGKNGAPSTAANEVAGTYDNASKAGQRQQLTWQGRLAANDYLEIYAYSDSANTLAGATTPIVASIHRLGAVSSRTMVNDGASVRRTGAGQSIADVTDVAVIFDTEDRDDGGYYSSGSATRFTITRSGWYILTGKVRWPSGTTGGRNVSVRKNGSTYIETLRSAALASAMTLSTQTVAGVAYLAAGEYVELLARQSQGSPLTLTATTPDEPAFSIHRLGIPPESAAPVSPDSYPASANVMDDEFEGTSLDAKWTWVNQGSASFAASRGYGVITLPTEATGNFRGIGQALPAGAFRFEARISNPNGRTNTVLSGWGIRENATGKALRTYRAYSSSAPQWNLSAWSSFTAISGSPLYSADDSATWDWSGPVYFAIGYDGSTTYTFQISHDGVVWQTIVTAAKATYFTTAADRIDLLTFNGNSGSPAYCAVDWFRRIS
jgi:hypothetical protein